MMYLHIYNIIHCVSVAAKNPSMPSGYGRIERTLLFTSFNPYFFAKCMICYQFSSANRLHVMYTIFPSFLRYFSDFSTIVYCIRRLYLSQSISNLSLISGFLLKVPVPVQGTSRINQSIFFLMVCSNLLQSLWNCTLFTPARSIRVFPFERAFGLMSCMKICPRFQRR